jgi:hypothetical protein
MHGRDGHRNGGLTRHHPVAPPGPPRAGFFMSGGNHHAQAAHYRPDLAVPAFALAQSMCGPFEEVQRALLTEFGERPVSIGKTVRFSIVTFANAESGTFTIIAVQPDGLAYHLASGQGWRDTKAREKAS